MKVTLWENSTSKIHYNEGSLDFASFPKEGKITWVYKQNMSEKALISSFKNSVLEIDFKLCQHTEKEAKTSLLSCISLRRILNLFFLALSFLQHEYVNETWHLYGTCHQSISTSTTSSVRVWYAYTHTLLGRYTEYQLWDRWRGNENGKNPEMYIHGHSLTKWGLTPMLNATTVGWYSTYNFQSFHDITWLTKWP